MTRLVATGELFRPDSTRYKPPPPVRRMCLVPYWRRAIAVGRVASPSRKLHAAEPAWLTSFRCSGHGSARGLHPCGCWNLRPGHGAESGLRVRCCPAFVHRRITEITWWSQGFLRGSDDSATAPVNQCWFHVADVERLLDFGEMQTSTSSTLES